MAPPVPARPALPVTYACAGGRGFAASFPTADSAIITAGTYSQGLPRVPAASGARYSDGTVTLWTRAREATLTGLPGGDYRGCAAR